MTYFGETIRKAREAKGMTTSQVAAQTRILVQIIDAMEKEDFSRIKAAIYGRGFVKLICECLGLDPKPLVAEFMDIYEGRRPPVSRDAFQPQPPPAPAPEPVPSPIVEQAPSAIIEAAPIQEPEPEPVPVPEPPPAPEPVSPPEPAPMPEPTPAPAPEPVQEAVKGLDLFDPPPPVETPPATRAQDIFASAYSEPDEPAHEGPSAAEKFRTGLSVVSHGVIGSVRSIPRSAWRMAVLIVGAVVVVGLLAWGCVVLYRVTEQPIVTNGPSETIPVAQPAPASAPAVRQPAAQPQKPQTPAAKPKLRSTGQKVPPLYVD